MMSALDTPDIPLDDGTERPTLEDDAPHLLLVDDDERLRSVLRRYLVRSGFRVTEARDAAAARTKLQSLSFDLMILDVMMPGESGVAFLADLRRSSRMPVLMLTAMSEPADRIAGLERGADDYLSKPFEPLELVLRLRNILSRVPAPALPEPLQRLSLGECQLDLVREELLRQGSVVHLTAGETALLLALAKRAGQPVSRDALNAYCRFNGTERTVDVQITRLRRKIERDPKFPRYLQTVRGTGYVLKPD
jgi:two-component system phosphate regulon response regulator OmpR